MMTRKILTTLVLTIGLTIAGLLQASDLTWNTGAGTWDTDTGNTPWNPGPTHFTDGDDVTFEDSVGSGGAISIPASVAPGSTTVDGTDDYTFTGAGGIASGALTKSGSGTLTIENGANSFSGITLNGGTLAYTSNHGATVNAQLGSGALITVGGDATFGGAPLSHGGGGAYITNPINIDAGATLTLSHAGGALYEWVGYSGLISGNGGLTYDSSRGIFISNSDNSFTGDITIQGTVGGMRFLNDGAFGVGPKTVFLDFGGVGDNVVHFAFDTDVAANRTLDIGTKHAQIRGNGQAWNGKVTGAGTPGGDAFWLYSSSLRLTNPDNDFTGRVNLYYGAFLEVSQPGNINGQTVRFAANNANNRLIVAGTSSEAWTGDITWAANQAWIDVVDPAAQVNWTGTLNGSGTLRKTGAGTFVVNNTTATGDVNIEGGAILFNDDTTANVGTFTVQNGATLGGTGVMNLAAGKLVDIQDGGTLTGTLTVTGDAGVTVADGGIVAPGDSAGTLTLSALTLSNESILQFDLSDPSVIGGGVNDLIAVTGHLVLDGLLEVFVDPLPPTDQISTYTLFTYGSLDDNGLELVTSLPKYAYIDTSIFGQVNLVVIPEPSTMILVAGALTGLLLRRRRRNVRTR